jgi:hypothetical protein
MNGVERFNYFLDKLDMQLREAVNQADPAWWLYKNDARTTAFILEGLSRIYESLHNKKKFSKLGDDFKKLEDSLGAIDYYDQLALSIQSIDGIDSRYSGYLKQKAIEKTSVANRLLTERKWIGKKRSRILRMREKLVDVNWLEEKQELERVQKFYHQSIKEINKFVEERNGVFTKMEDELHEYRRKIRWLSIYPKSLNGAIQFSGELADKPELNEYFTPETINSPFNKMPSPEGQRVIMYISKPDFFALSWMISAAGKWKDKGLEILGLAEAVQSLDNLDKEQALAKAENMLAKDHPSIPQILDEASKKISAYHATRSLDALV